MIFNFSIIIATNRNSLSGFGKKKQETKSSSKKYGKLSEKDLKERSIQNHLKGNIKEAQNGYITFIKNGYLDADIFSNYALICEENGHFSKAIKLYERSSSIFPYHIFSKLNLAFLYYKLNDFKKAEIIIDEAIKLKPELPNGYCIKGLILKKINKFNDSKLFLEKAIEIDNNYLDAYINLGLLHQEYSNYDDAEKYYLKAIKINNESSIAHLNLGACYREKRDLEKAILHTNISIKFNPKIKDSYLNLSTLYSEKGEYNESLRLAKKELKINPDSEVIYQLIFELIQKVKLFDLSNKGNREILNNLLNRKDISHRELFKSINTLISTETLIKLSTVNSELSNNKEFNLLIKEKELIKSLTLLIFCSPIWEKALINLRENILMDYSENKSINKNIFNFLIALGTQCFLNEYVYYISSKEKRKLDEVKRLLNTDKHKEYKIALISCYQSLYSIKDRVKDLINYKSSNNNFNKLIDLQLREIFREKEISTEIKRVGDFSDSISRKVKSQYELNPYPRWRYNSYAKENKINVFTIINSEIYPSIIKQNPLNLSDKKVSILIAGCGTGMQILEASRYRNCEITAIDLSNSSISYAKRKTEEYGMNNINYIEMDLLELNQLNKKFDLIECSGVLHHMKDPAKGLFTLIDSLEANGFLKLGLYSKYARQEILKARELIKKRDIKPNIDEIRTFRNDLLNGNIKQLSQIKNWADFYSTSMCRDLCFHSQEKCYTLLEIKNLIETTNLEFLGFILSKDTKDNYLRKNNYVESLTDLFLWDKFEKTNPYCFREMYQFWLRNSIK